MGWVRELEMRLTLPKIRHRFIWHPISSSWKPTASCTWRYFIVPTHPLFILSPFFSSSFLELCCPQQQTQYKAVSFMVPKPSGLCIAELCHSTPGETTSRRREYNIDVKCCCSPIQITKFHLSLPHSLLPQLGSEVSCQQRCWFPIQFRMQHANKHY